MNGPGPEGLPAVLPPVLDVYYERRIAEIERGDQPDPKGFIPLDELRRLADQLDEIGSRAVGYLVTSWWRGWPWLLSEEP